MSGEREERGHNSGAVNAAHLRAFIERVERLEEEKRAIADDIKDVYAEAKGNGFDAKIMRKIVALRRQDIEKRKEEETILDLYMNALGMLADTPLGEAAMESALQDHRRAKAPASKDDSVRRALSKFGKPVPLTEAEKAEGYQAAFVDSKGQRVAMGVRTG